MTISLVIPAYNEGAYIGPCLEAALREGKGRFLEIIVVDNASTDNTAEVASSYPGVRVVREDKKGITKARARGLLEAQGDLVAYIDADTRMPAGWFDKVFSAFEKDATLVCFSGPYRYYDAPVATNIIMTVLWWLFVPLMYRIVGYLVLGGNFVAKKSALLAMGGFDTSIEFYGEDTDIARRISRFGRVVFRMDFFIYSSQRRYVKEGIIFTNVTYAINFFTQVFFGTSYTKGNKDHRLISPDQ